MSLKSTGGHFELVRYAKHSGILAGRNQVPDTMNVEFIIKNNANFAIENCGVSFSWFYRTNSGEANLVSGNGYVYGNSNASTAISWASGANYTFRNPVTLSGNVYSSMYDTPTVNGTLQVSQSRGYGILITIVYKRTVINAATNRPETKIIAEYIRLTQDETDAWVPVWIEPFAPSIQVNAVRFDNTYGVSDEGEKILVAVKVDKRSNFTVSQMTAAGYPSTLAVSLGSSATASPQGTTAVSLADCINGVFEFTINAAGKISARVSEPGVYKGNVSAANDYVLTVGFMDSFEPCVASVQIAKAFANVHLSEFKGGSVPGLEEGGVCFGGFSKSADIGKALFESYYPSMLYGGIEQIGKKNADGELWNELALASASITTPGTYGDSLKIRKIENKCIIKGSVMIKPGSGTTTIAVLPEEYKPMRCTYRLNGCQGARMARVAVHGTEGTNYGELVLEWVYDIGGEKFTSNAIWVDCAIEYWID